MGWSDKLRLTERMLESSKKLEQVWTFLFFLAFFCDEQGNFRETVFNTIIFEVVNKWSNK